MNLMRNEWSDLDPSEIQAIVIGQFGSCMIILPDADETEFPFPNKGESCHVIFVFDSGRIVGIHPGEGFNSEIWERTENTINQALLNDFESVCRSFCFCNRPVIGSWSGKESGVQILPPPEDAPTPGFLLADHPFVLECNYRKCSDWQVSQERARKKLSATALALNVFVENRIKFPSGISRHDWVIEEADSRITCRYAQLAYCGKLTGFNQGGFTNPTSSRIHEYPFPCDPSNHPGNDNLELPSNLDNLLERWSRLNSAHLEMFERASHWLCVASLVWEHSVSMAFASLVASVEALTTHGEKHKVYCPQCNRDTTHSSPGPTKLFKDFLEQYSSSGVKRKTLDSIYKLRSQLVHGSDLMELKRYVSCAWDSSERYKEDLRRELWSVIKPALRNWLIDNS